MKHISMSSLSTRSYLGSWGCLLLLTLLTFASRAQTISITESGGGGNCLSAGQADVVTRTGSSGSPVRNTYTGTNGQNGTPLRVIWSSANNRWEIQNDFQLNGTWPVLYYSTVASAPNPPTSIGNYGNWTPGSLGCNPLVSGTGFTGTGTQAPASTPTITGLSPSSGPVGTVVTITGTNLTGTTAVVLRGIPVNITPISNTQVSFVVPAQASTGPIRLTTPNGTVLSSTNFTVTRASSSLTYVQRSASFNNINVGSFSTPAITDLDHDGLIDLLVGREIDGLVSHYEQNAPNSVSFTLRTNNLSGLTGHYNSIVSVTDIDGDGLIDMVVGSGAGNFKHYEQSNINSTSFTQLSSDFNNIFATGGTTFQIPHFTDINGDGLIDLLVGDEFLDRYEQNAPNSLIFSLDAKNFTNTPDAGNGGAAACVTDLDGDGLLDMLIGRNNGQLFHYRQTNTNSAAFIQISSAFSGLNLSGYTAPAITDLDGDGLLDLLIGGADGVIRHYEQTTPPVFTSNPTSKSVCTGSGTTFSVAATGATSYQWQVNTGGGFTNLSNAAPYSGVTSATLTINNVAGLNGYEYRSVATGDGISVNSNPATLTVNALPTATLASSGTLTCVQTNVTLTATSGASAYTFTAPGGAVLPGSGNTRTVSSPGTYSVTIANASGCISSTSTTVISNTAVITTNSPATNTVAINTPFSQTFTASGGVAPYSYSIASGSLPTGLSLATNGVLSGTPTQGGSFTVVVRGTDANGCFDLSPSYVLTVNATPNISGFNTLDNTVCVGSPITFTATVGNVTASYNYTLTNGSSPLSGTATGNFSQSLTASGSGVQTYTLTVSNGGTPAAAVTSLTVGQSGVARLYVKANATGANSGLSWQDAFTDLQSALKYPCVGNLREIWIARGVYNRGAQPFSMLPDVAIYGGFEGTETDLSQRPLINLSNPPSTTLTGQAPFTGFYYIIQNTVNLTNTAILDGVEITIPTSGSLSSGITNRSFNSQVCSPQFRNLLFRGYVNTGNAATSNGLFVQNDASSGGEVSPSFVNCVFRDNQSIGLIGRFYNVSFTNSVVRPQFINCAVANHTGDSFLLNQLNGGQIQPQFINCSFLNVPNGVSSYEPRPANGSSLDLQFTNCVLWNTGGNNTFRTADANFSYTVTAQYSLLDGAITGYTSGPGNLTATSSPFASASDLSLPNTSPAVNAGNPASVTVASSPYSATNLPQTDAAANPRIVGSRVDMGALEVQNPVSPCGTVVYVTQNGAGVQNGSSWANAFAGTSLQTAINTAATCGAQVWVAQGIYKPTTGTDARVSFVMKPAVAIYGGFRGTEGQLGERPGVNPVTGQPSSSTLSGDIGTPEDSGANSDNSGHVVRSEPGLTANAVLDGFVITKGNATNTPVTGTFESSGGGFFNTNANPTIRNCFFIDNFGSDAGGIYTDDSSPTIINCRFESNTAASGGAIFTRDTGTITITGCLFEKQTVGGAIYSSLFSTARVVVSNSTFRQNTGYSGGAFRSGDRTALELTDCLLENNTSSDNGGGAIYSQSEGSLKLTRCQFINNRAQEDGGAVYFQGNVNLEVTGCRFTGNSAVEEGGAISFTGSSLTLTNSLFENNRGAGGDGGGAVFVNGGLVTIVNTSFVSNTATNGGAVFFYGTNHKVANGSFVNNVATGQGGAIYDASGSLQLTNSSFQGNQAPQGGAMYTEGDRSQLVNSVLFNNGGANTFVLTNGVSLSASYSLFEPNVTSYTDGGNNLTTTLTPFVSTTSTQLRDCSVAINTGSNSAYSAANGPTTDLAGNPRLFNGGVIDRGAYEYQGNPTTLTVTNPAVSTATVNQPFSQAFTASGGSGSYSFSVVSSNLPTSLSVSASGVLSGTPTVAGSYSVLVSAQDQNGCVGVANSAYSLTVSSTTPTITGFAVAPNPVCVGSPIIFTATIGNIAGNYSWSLSNGGPPIGSPEPTTASAFSVVQTASGSGVQTFTLTVNSGGQTVTATTSLTVNSSPIASLTNNGPLTCAQTSVTLTASEGSSYTFTSPGGQVLAGMGNTRTISSPGSYSVTVANASGCVSSTSTIVESITATISVTNPAVTTATQGTAFSQPFTASGGTAPYSYSPASGSLPPGVTLSSAGLLSGTPTQAGSFTLTVRARDANGCSGVGATYTLTVDGATPTITGFGATPNPVCVGNLVTFTATIGNVTGSYSYTLSNGPSSTLGTASTPNFSQSLTATGSGSQSFTLTLSTNGQTATATTTLTVDTPPLARLVNNGPLSCTQTSVTLTASGGNSYTFSTGNGTVIGTPGSASTVVVSTPGVYSVVVANASGCTSTTSTTVFSNTATPLLSINPSSATLTCTSLSVSLTATGEGTVLWNTGATTPVITVNTADTYSVTLTNASGCTATASAIVSQAPDQSIAFTQQPRSATTVTVGATVSASVSVSGVATTFQWYKDNLSSPVSGQTSATLTLTNVQLSDAGSYSVVVTGNCNSLTSTAFSLSVVSPAAPLSLTLSASPTQLLTNQSTTLAATVAGGTSPYSYRFAGPGTITPNGNTATVSGLPAGVQTLTVVVTDAGSPAQTLTSLVSVTVSEGVSAPFAITSVTTLNCTPIQPNRFSVSFTPNYSGLNGQPIVFRIVNELLPTSEPGPYTIQLYSDNPVIGLQATQQGTSVEASFRYNWLEACRASESANTPPRLVSPIPPQSATVGVGFSYVIPAGTFTDEQTPGSLRLSATGLPPGIGLSGYTLSGAPSTTVGSPFSVTITATDPGNLSVSTSFRFPVAPAPNQQPQPTQPFAITGVSMLTCTPIADRININFSPRYSGLTGQAIAFRVENELAATNEPGPYSLTLYRDNPVITLKATQTGSVGEASFTYNWLAACATQGQDNTAPQVVSPVGNQTLVAGTATNLNLANVFLDQETPQGLTLSATGLPSGLALVGTAIQGVASTTGVSMVVLTATDPGGLSASTNFLLTVTAPVSPTVGEPSGFTITGVQTLSCVVVSAGLRAVTFIPQYGGVNGQSISFQVVNERAATTDPGPYTLNLYTDNPIITLRASQVGSAVEANFVYNWLGACSSQPSARVGTGDTNEPGLRVRVLGNPTQENQAWVLIEGAGQEPVQLRVADERGRLVSEQTGNGDHQGQPQAVGLGRTAGVYLLEVSTPTQRRTVKISKQ